VIITNEINQSKCTEKHTHTISTYHYGELDVRMHDTHVSSHWNVLNMIAEISTDGAEISTDGYWLVFFMASMWWSRSTLNIFSCLVPYVLCMVISHISCWYNTTVYGMLQSPICTRVHFCNFIELSSIIQKNEPNMTWL
jgi:hypothetical protein